MSSVITFEAAGFASVVIRNREPGNTRVNDRGQVQGRTDGTQVFSYDVAVASEVYAFEFMNVTETERSNFDAFFDNSAQGVHTAFTVTIPRELNAAIGIAGPEIITGARFVDTALVWRNMKPRDGWWTLAFDLYTQTAGPTAPPT